MAWRVSSDNSPHGRSTLCLLCCTPSKSMPDSLFGSDSDSDALDDPPLHAPLVAEPPLASSVAPEALAGLYLLPKALPVDLHDQLAQSLSQHVWTGASDQVMLFERTGHSSFPSFLDPLVAFLPSLTSTLPEHVQDLLNDATKPRQAILNLYRPGQGITPHVDLESRYADGILGVSLLTSTVMDFRPASSSPSSAPVHSVRLLPRDVYVLSGPARFEWSHGIADRDEDMVADECGEPMVLRRGVRMSITLRRMKAGAEVIGPQEEEGQAPGAS